MEEAELIDKTFLLVTLIGGLAITLLVGAGFIFVLHSILKKDLEKGAQGLALILEKTQFLRISVVLIVIASLVLLALADRVSDGILSLLSAIVGYILGGMSFEKKPKTDSKG